MVIYIKENFEMGKKMVKGFILIIMEINIKANGQKKIKMDKENIHINQMENGIKECGKII